MKNDDYALQKEEIINLEKPLSTDSSTGISNSKVIDAYSIEDWSALPNFAGDFINFGYWKGINLRDLISLDDRIKSSENLYLEVAANLSINNKDRVLEVGCGRGRGSLLLVESMQPSQMIGIDLTAAQIDKAQKLLNRNTINNLQFQIADGATVNFEDNFFDKIISIEVLQHISSLKEFIQNIYRILKPKRMFGIATYFSTSINNYSSLEELFPLIHEKQESFVPLTEFSNLLKEIGFTTISQFSIGNLVFAGYERWITQVK